MVPCLVIDLLFFARYLNVNVCIVLNAAKNNYVMKVRVLI